MFSSFTLPKFRVSMGWPCKHGYALKKYVIGECHSKMTSKDGCYEIFISPRLDDPLLIAGTLCHELVHALVGTQAGHGPLFVKRCKYVGLTKGKPTHVGPGKKLELELQKILRQFPEYPHKAIVPLVKFNKKNVKDVKLGCPVCGCNFRMTKYWVNKSGLPSCGCGQEMLVLPSRKGQSS